MGTFALLAVGVLAVSLSGPLMAATVVPPLAIAFWRNALGSVAVAPTVGLRRVDELRGMSRRTWWLTCAAGAALAVHFGTWVTSLTLTSVSSATALVCLQIAWVVAWQLLRGERFDRRVVLGLVTAFSGTLIVSGVDLSLSTRALVGDLLALVGGAMAGAYVLIGAQARRVLATSTYTLVCYGLCSVLLLVACVVAGQALWGYDERQWGLLLLVTLTSQLLGHSVFNHLLATTSPTVVSLALLLEVPGASLLAAAFLGQVPPVGAVAGLAVVLLGMVLVVVNMRSPGGSVEPAAID